MAADFALEAQARSVVGKKVNRLRNSGMVPATIYGPNIEAINVQFPYRPLQLALMNAGGTNIIDIQVNGETYPVLAREVQRDILRGDIMHVDFFAIDMKSTIRTDVPIVFIGESPVVQDRRGILMVGTNTITIETLPSKLMNQVEVDITTLTELGASITVADIQLGPDIVIINEPEELIAKVVQTGAARAEEALGDEEVGEEGSAEPEVIHKGKDQDED